MKTRIYKIDDNGFLLFGEDMFIDESEQMPNDYISVPLPTDEQDNQPPFYKPKWNDTEWVEGATQEEIDELTKVEPSPPTIEEQLAEKDAQILKLKEEQFITQQLTMENTASQQELIELLIELGVI